MATNGPRQVLLRTCTAAAHVLKNMTHFCVSLLLYADCKASAWAVRGALFLSLIMELVVVYAQTAWAWSSPALPCFPRFPTSVPTGLPLEHVFLSAMSTPFRCITFRCNLLPRTSQRPTCVPCLSSGCTAELTTPSRITGTAHCLRGDVPLQLRAHSSNQCLRQAPATFSCKHECPLKLSYESGQTELLECSGLDTHHQTTSIVQ